jgi:hypothetical protein
MRIANDARRRKKDVRSAADINTDITTRIVTTSHAIVDADGPTPAHGAPGDATTTILKTNTAGGRDEGIIRWIEGKEMEETGLQIAVESVTGAVIAIARTATLEMTITAAVIGRDHTNQVPRTKSDETGDPVPSQPIILAAVHRAMKGEDSQDTVMKTEGMGGLGQLQASQMLWLAARRCKRRSVPVSSLPCSRQLQSLTKTG